MSIRYSLFLSAILAIPSMSFGQNAVTEYNNGLVRARIHSGGRMGSNPITGTSGYFVPASSNTSPLYSSGLWFSGTSSEGQTSAFGHLYGNPQPFSVGPLTTDGSATLGAGVPSAYDRFWTVSRYQVEAHVAFHQCIMDPDCDIAIEYPSGYTIPPSFAQWPAQGNVDAGQAAYLAPFVDVDNDGAYDPAAGDHPCLPGDVAIYHLFNDQGEGQIEGQAMGLEVHMTVSG